MRGEVALARAEFEQMVDRVTAGVITLFGAMMLADLSIVLIAEAQALARVMPIGAPQSSSVPSCC